MTNIKTGTSEDVSLTATETHTKELPELRLFKVEALALLESIHPVVKREDYVAAKRVYDFVVKHKR